jgi:hypothetical protein
MGCASCYIGLMLADHYDILVKFWLREVEELSGIR